MPGEETSDTNLADEWDKYTAQNATQYILENHTETYEEKFMNVYFLRFKNIFSRGKCHDLILENVEIHKKQGLKVSYSTDMFKPVPTAVVKFYGDNIASAIKAIPDEKVERNVLEIISHLKEDGFENSLFMTV